MNKPANRPPGRRAGGSPGAGEGVGGGGVNGSVKGRFGSMKKGVQAGRPVTTFYAARIARTAPRLGSARHSAGGSGSSGFGMTGGGVGSSFTLKNASNSAKEPSGDLPERASVESFGNTLGFAGFGVMAYRGARPQRSQPEISCFALFTGIRHARPFAWPNGDYAGSPQD